MSEVRTSLEWLEEAMEESRLVILDPDGWDRANFSYSFYQELISKAEFEKRVGFSTCFYVPEKAPKDKEK